MPDVRPTLAQSVLRVVNRIRHRGLAEVATLGLNRLREGVASEDELIMFLRVVGGSLESLGDLKFRRATADDAERYARDIATDSPTTFRARLTQRTHCYVVESNDRLVHATWATIAVAWTREIRAYLRPPPGDAYIYESYTRPEMRGRGVYPFALRGIAAVLEGEGLHRIWVAVEAHNPSSIRAVTKAGFAEAFRISFSRRLGRLRIQPPAGEMADLGRSFLTRDK